MDQRSFIASRIDAQMRHHLDQAVDVHRAVTDLRYQRDLLLVCDAMEDTELPHLAAQFRVSVELFENARRALSPRKPTRLAADAPPPREPVAAGTKRMSFSR